MAVIPRRSHSGGSSMKRSITSPRLSRASSTILSSRVSRTASLEAK
jgi:hypothetical protein